MLFLSSLIRYLFFSIAQFSNLLSLFRQILVYSCVFIDFLHSRLPLDVPIHHLSFKFLWFWYSKFVIYFCYRRSHRHATFNFILMLFIVRMMCPFVPKIFLAYTFLPPLSLLNCDSKNYLTFKFWTNNDKRKICCEFLWTFFLLLIFTLSKKVVVNFSKINK